MTPVLVVDDEPQIRSYLRRLLSQEGFDIREAHDGPTAISVIRELSGNIAALVTDIEMKGMSGIALAKAVTGQFPQIPVLFVTAVLLSEEDLRRDMPRCAFLQKPFDPRKLVQLLRALLARSE